MKSIEWIAGVCLFVALRLCERLSETSESLRSLWCELASFDCLPFLVLFRKVFILCDEFDFLKAALFTSGSPWRELWERLFSVISSLLLARTETFMFCLSLPV